MQETFEIVTIEKEAKWFSKFKVNGKACQSVQEYVDYMNRTAGWGNAKYQKEFLRKKALKPKNN